MADRVDVRNGGQMYVELGSLLVDSLGSHTISSMGTVGGVVVL